MIDTVINKLLENPILLGYDSESPVEFQFSKSSKSLLYFELPPYNDFILIHHIIEGVVSQSDISKICIFKDITKTLFHNNFVFTRIISNEKNKEIIKSLSVSGFKNSELSFWYFDESLRFS